MDGECQDETRRLEELKAGWSSGSGKEEGNALEKGNPWCYPSGQDTFLFSSAKEKDCG